MDPSTRLRRESGDGSNDPGRNRTHVSRRSGAITTRPQGLRICLLFEMLLKLNIYFTISLRRDQLIGRKGFTFRVVRILPELNCVGK